MARQNIDGTDFIGGNGRTKVNDNFIELYLSQPPLAEDYNAETDPITDYPAGISIMPVSAVADWDAYGQPATVTTYGALTFGWQTCAFEDTDEVAFRCWSDLNDTWSTWIYFGNKYQPFTRIAPLQVDDVAEATAITSFTEGFQVMPVSGGANWGPNTGEAGIVHTTRSGSDGTQTFHAYNNNQYRRAYTSSAWSSWTAT